MKITIPLLLLLTGCVSNVHRIGKIGDTQFYSIHERSFDGPNIAVIAVKTPDGKIDYISAANGPGIGSAVVSAGGAVGSSLVLRPARTSVNTSGGTGVASADSSASSAGSTGSTTNNGAHDNQNGNSNH